MRLTITGEIQKLGPSKIAIGKIACAIPSKLAASAGRFVIGDPVRMTCAAGKLYAVKYSPELATAQTNGPASTAAPAAPAVPPSGAVSAFSATFGFVVLGTGVVASSTSGALASASGTIDGIDSTSITVNGLTCSLPTIFATLVATVSRPLVGWKATLTCRSDTGAIASLSARSA
jgi:hypothetical protein